MLRVLSGGLVAFVLLSGFAAADTHTWTTQSDFQSGTLDNLNAAASPGDLLLALNATAFAKYGGNPVLTPSVTGWDSYQVIPSTVLNVGGTYEMWYTGNDGVAPSSTGYATSSDGVTWTKYSSNPVLISGRIPHVILEGGTYKMWYTTDTTPWSIAYATSSDGVHWTNYSGNPVLAPSASGWDSGAITSGPVLHNATGYYMWYSATADAMTWDAGLANSTDGINWTKYAGNPIITVPFGGWWDAERVQVASVLPWQGGLLLTYLAVDTSFTQRIGMASSTDGVHWQPETAPILDMGPAGAWDSTDLSGSSTMVENGNLTMWYGGTGTSPYSYSTGLARTPGYGPVGTFVSAVLDSGGNGTTWTSLNFTASNVSGGSVTLAARSGDTTIPGPTWSAWSPDSSGNASLSIPRSRYVQVRATLSTSDSSVTPVLHSITLTYMLDRTGPPTPTSPPPGSWTANGTVVLQWQFQDPDPGDTQRAFEVQMSTDPSFASVGYDSGVAPGASGSWSIPAPADGTWFWRVRTEDSWGAWSAYGNTSVLRVDRTSPSTSGSYSSPTIVAGGHRYVSDQTLITLSASDGVDGIGVFLVVYGLDNALPSFYTVPFRLNATDGLHTFRFSAIDLLGNAEPLQVVSLYVDNTGPTSSIALSPSGDGFDIEATANDAGSGVTSVYVSIDSGPWTTFGQAIFLDTAGTHEVRAYAVDALGNLGTTATTTFTIPNLKPYVSGSIGTLGLIVGLLLVRRPRRRGWALGAATAVVGGLEIAIAAASAGTLSLGIPPWQGLSILLDGILAGLIVVLAFLAWHMGRGSPARPPPPTTPPAG